MKLYHGTSESFAREIISHGIHPRGEKEGNWGEVPSRADLVYLSDAYAPYFACATSKSGERWAIVEVDVNLEELLPDEDFLEQASRGAPPPGDYKQRTVWFRDNLESYLRYTPDSLQKLGNASHKGVIQQDRIVKVVFFDSKEASYIAHMAMDPSITILNYWLMKRKYRALTRALMGYQVAPEELCDPFWEQMDAVNREVFLDGFCDLPRALEVAYKKCYCNSTPL